MQKRPHFLGAVCLLIVFFITAFQTASAADSAAESFSTTGPTSQSGNYDPQTGVYLKQLIEFRLEQNNVRFQINQSAADSVHLIMSSDLLKVATAVIRTAGPGG